MRSDICFDFSWDWLFLNTMPLLSVCPKWLWWTRGYCESRQAMVIYFQLTRNDKVTSNTPRNNMSGIDAAKDYCCIVLQFYWLINPLSFPQQERPIGYFRYPPPCLKIAHYGATRDYCCTAISVGKTLTHWDRNKIVIVFRRYFICIMSRKLTYFDWNCIEMCFHQFSVDLANGLATCNKLVLQPVISQFCNTYLSYYASMS